MHEALEAHYKGKEFVYLGKWNALCQRTCFRCFLQKAAVDCTSPKQRPPKPALWLWAALLESQQDTRWGLRRRALGFSPFCSTQINGFLGAAAGGIGLNRFPRSVKPLNDKDGQPGQFVSGRTACSSPEQVCTLWVSRMNLDHSGYP